MGVAQTIINIIFDGLLFPFRSAPPVIGLGAMSLATGILMLLTVRYTSNQKGIRAAKEKIKAHLLGIRLFKDDPVLVVGAQKEIARATLAYVKYALPPFAVMLLPFIILLLQLNLYFGYHPLRPGESTIVAVRLREQLPWSDMPVRLDVPQGLVVETPALRMAEEREVAWRVRATQGGRFDLAVQLAGQEFRKAVWVTDRLVRVIPTRRRASLLARVFAPGEVPLPSDALVEVITVGYRPRAFSVVGWEIPWFILFLGLSLGSGYLLHGVFRVEI